jgi:hypothetical protein
MFTNPHCGGIVSQLGIKALYGWWLLELQMSVTVTVSVDVPLSDIGDKELLAELKRRREDDRPIGQPPEAVFVERLYYALLGGSPDEIRHHAEELCRINDYIL